LKKKKKKKKKKGRKKKVLWRGEKEEKEPKKRIERSIDDVVGRVWREEGKKKKNLVYLGLNYFGAIFYFLPRYWLRIGGYKMEGLHFLMTKVKLFFNLSLFVSLGLLVSYYQSIYIKKFNIYLSIFNIFLS
jgi:hypothetical protein